MKTPPRTLSAKIWIALTALLIAGLAVGFWTHFGKAHAAHNHGGHDDHGTAALSLDDGKRWETDQPMREAMQRIRAAALPVLAAHREGQISSAEAKAMSETIVDAVSDMVAKCKLSPKADATLHVLITDLMSGAGLLAQDAASKEGAALIEGALRLYPEYFDHPGWTPGIAAAGH